MPIMKRICVFCGSNAGLNPVYVSEARRLGNLIAARGSSLVYGGAKLGLMGAIADAVLAGGGEAIGVIPASLVDKEIAHAGLTELHTVGSMHERKALMEKLSDTFIAMPGGYGTLDEFCEILTWAQLGLHRKPCGIFNINCYYDRLLGMLDHGVAEGFLKGEHRAFIVDESDPEALLDRLSTYEVRQSEKWINREQT